jgi:hypothetical protein
MNFVSGSVFSCTNICSLLEITLQFLLLKHKKFGRAGRSQKNEQQMAALAALFIKTESMADPQACNHLLRADVTVIVETETC